jgi:hypothetical protein
MKRVFAIVFLLNFSIFANELDESIAKGIDFLVRSQNPTGSWGSAAKTKALNIYAPGAGAHEAFRGAVTALCVLALIQEKDLQPEAQKALQKGVDYLLLTYKDIRRVDGRWLGNIWTHTYTMKVFLALKKSGKISLDQKLIDEVINHEIAMLKMYAYYKGGWGYYDFNLQTDVPSGSATSFLTGTCLIVLKQASLAGYEVPEKMTNQALDFLETQRKPDNSFLYSEGFEQLTNLHINKIVASLARSQSALRGLYEWRLATVKKEVFSEWIYFLIERNGWLDVARKRPVPHESWNKIASYFYYYGH